MPRDGANILSNVRVPVLTVVCEPCGRRERYDVERLTLRPSLHFRCVIESKGSGPSSREFLVLTVF